MAEPLDPDGLPCVFRGCDKADSTCIYTCNYSDPFLSPPPPPPPPPPAASASHVAPFLIATVCILGIAFLLLTTCTIILRCRFRRRRRIPPATAGHAPNDDEFSGRSVVDHPIWNIVTVGLQQSVIDSITAFEYKKMDGLLIEGCDCSVCLTEFEDGETLRLLPKCSHAFHVSCIDTWLRSHKNCPVCRAPVVNDNNVAVGGSFSVVSSNSGNFDGGEEGEAENSESLDLERGDDSNDPSRERGDELGELPIEGTRIAEILKQNRELRILSDLGQNYRFRGEEDDVDPIRRSISFNSVAASAICRAMSNVFTVGNEGCSSNADLGVQDDEEDEEKKNDNEKASKRGTSMSGLLMKSSSIGRSLQKGPVSMKRSISSSSKLFSFRRTKSQASILPL